MDSRVQDFLDDKLQSAADLESIDSLLENVKAQQDLLKKQLADAKREHQQAVEASRKHTESIQRKAQDFEKEQEDIDRRLLIVTQSETSDDAVQKFEDNMARLRKLDVAAGYVELLKQVEVLRAECVSKLGKDDDAALEPYKRLQHLAASLITLQYAAEGAAPHLLDHISACVQDLRHTIQNAFSANLEATLKKMNWPKSTNRVALALEKEWATNIDRLLDLQKQELENREHLSTRSPNEDPAVLLPFEVLVRPLEQRFIYHFSGNKPTNRLDKPEYFLSHVTDLIANYSDFVQDNLQHILLHHFHRSDLAFTPAYTDALSAFITALMPMLKTKVSTVARQVCTQPSLLSHLMQQVMQFDITLQESYAYTPISSSMPWRGLSYFLLDTCGWFKDWLAAERDFALQRYQAIVEPQEAGELDFDAVSAEATKPTRAAVRVNDLLETITERYRHLASFSQKIRFLIDIQIEIFDMYFKRLQSGLEAYMTLTSTVGRTMHSMSKDDQSKVQGVNGLDRICRIFGSAEYLERAMRDWSDDDFFLELWAELDYRSKNRDQVNQTMGSWQEVVQKTSSSLGGEADGGLEGALFDETASSYQRVRERSENILTETVIYDIRQALKPYGSIGTWASLSSHAAGSSVCSELDPTLTLLKEYFGFLRRAVGKAPLQRISLQVCSLIQNFVWDKVLTQASFSTAGATQLTADMQAVCSVIDRYVGPGQAQLGMRKLLEGITLLSLPVRGEIERVRPGSSGGDDEDASAWEDTNGATATEDGKRMSLFQAERLVFQDNEGARHALELLGLNNLGEADARAVLGKRVELSS